MALGVGCGVFQIENNHIWENTPSNCVMTNNEMMILKGKYKMATKAYDNRHREEHNMSPLSCMMYHVTYCSLLCHYSDLIMNAMASQTTGDSIVYSTIYSCADQRKHQGPASLAFVRGIHWSPVKSPRKRPVMWKMFPLDDVIMDTLGPEPNVQHFSDNIFKFIFLNEN